MMATASWRQKLLSALSTQCLVIVTTLVLACSATKRPAHSFRVALVTPGSISDAAWNSGAFTGLQQIRDSLGAQISQIEAHTPAEQEEALRTYAAQGYDLVFGHGFEFQGPGERVAAQYPKTTFIITSGERVQGRVAPLVFHLSEASYLAGMVAGGLSKTGTIGFVGGIELPPIKEAQNAWEAGARAINPKIVSRATYLNSFDDIAAGREATLALIRVGADMLHHNADAAALGLFQAVKQSANAYAFGSNLDQTALAPDRVMGSAIIDLPRAFLAVAREVKSGTFIPHVEVFGLKSGVIRYETNPALAGRIPAALQARVSAARDSIESADHSPTP